MEKFENVTPFEEFEKRREAKGLESVEPEPEKDESAFEKKRSLPGLSFKGYQEKEDKARFFMGEDERLLTKEECEAELERVKKMEDPSMEKRDLIIVEDWIQVLGYVVSHWPEKKKGFFDFLKK